ncbi:hypothetical protein CK203_054952 [Vitis vinifera]|uniref:Uncharacterized protein n=1 Tax=Vitis vinifera TaxID=29760 RepID=A0A438GJ85_VITVI|nr:hypothetical protein CK203_054952 [Vitis vinifera]
MEEGPMITTKEKSSRWEILRVGCFEFVRVSKRASGFLGQQGVRIDWHGDWSVPNSYRFKNCEMILMRTSIDTF